MRRPGRACGCVWLCAAAGACVWRCAAPWCVCGFVWRLWHVCGCMQRLWRAYGCVCGCVWRLCYVCGCVVGAVCASAGGGRAVRLPLLYVCQWRLCVLLLVAAHLC